MIQPVQRDAVLLHDIENTHPEPGEIALWWLGQSGFAIKTASILFYVDLYLSEHLTKKYADTSNPHVAMMESPLHPDEITNAQWVFSSHKHSDHLDPGTILPLFAASPDAKLILPTAIVDHVVSLGLGRERLIPIDGNETFQIGTMTVHTIPSAHPDLDYNEATGYPFLGFGFEVDGVKIYHSGDTVIYDGLESHLKRFKPDIVLLPINGAEGKKQNPDIAPNMTAQEAVELAQAVDARLLIPHHYDMFTFNTFDVNEFAKMAEAAHQPYKILQSGEPFRWQKR